MKARFETEQWKSIEAIFHRALEVPTDLRSAKIIELSGGDPVVIKEVESLVRAAENAEEFLEGESSLGTQYSAIVRRWTIDKPDSSSKSSVHEWERSTKPPGMDTEAPAHWPEHIDLETVKESFSVLRPDLVLREKIGQGASGIVLRATDQRLNRDVAVKLFHRHWFQRAGRESLLRETQAATFSHDHVVRLYEVSPTQSPLPYLIMEWIAGPSLREFLNSEKSLTYREIARLSREVSLGLAVAHAAGIVHGDIKPANILLEPNKLESFGQGSSTDSAGSKFPASEITSASYRAKLTDFGLSRKSIEKNGSSIESESTTEVSGGGEGRVVGTPAYVSPEQMLRGNASTISSDIWGLGATLYHMLCGSPPFVGRPHVIVRQMQNGELKAPREIDPKIPIDLECICLKALAFRPEDRYASASEFAEDLQRFLDGKPVAARPVSKLNAFGKLMRREPVATTLVVGIIFSLCIGLLVSQYFRWRAVRDAKVAAEERDRSRAVTDLLKGLIGSIDPSVGDPNIKMVDVLSILDAKLVSTFAKDPMVEAELRSILGSMQFSVGAYEESVRQFERAIELRGGSSLSESQIKDRIELANAVRWLYQPERALDLALKANRDAETNCGTGSSITIQSMEVLAGCYKDQGDYQKAVELLELAISRAEIDTRTLTTRSNLASVLIDMREYAKAEDELRTLIDATQKDPSFSKTEALMIQSNLGTALVEQGKLAEAIQTQQECVDKAKALLGLGHDFTITAYLNYADSMRRLGNSEAAAEIYAELLGKCRDELGVAHAKTIDAAESLIYMWVRMQKFTPALELAEKTSSELEGLLPADDGKIYRLQAAKAAALSKLGRIEEAATLYEKIISYFSEKFDPADTTVITHRNNYGLVLIDAQRSDEAVKLYEDVLTLFQDKEASSMTRVLNRNYGLALLRNSEVEKARAILERTLAESQKFGEAENVTKCEQYLAECQLSH